jgi:hypothetical protein
MMVGVDQFRSFGGKRMATPDEARDRAERHRIRQELPTRCVAMLYMAMLLVRDCVHDAAPENAPAWSYIIGGAGQRS